MESVDAIIHALYDVISGGVGEARDWDRFRSLFAPQGRLVPTFTNPQGQRGYLVWTPDEYVQRSGDALSRIGFRETELARTTEQFGNVTHAFSTYASFRSDQGDPDTAFARGINSIQLYHDGTRYWILSVMWDSERPGQPIPERYLGG
ncbi:MAG: hypothetical protein D6701_11050 [Gemmatimonadetes bacterium]|nr:MAG: hypothetical protein D6701_11050 [Gemmatimonadota bacterium]